jgi:hypothetical protein
MPPQDAIHILRVFYLGVFIKKQKTPILAFNAPANCKWQVTGVLFVRHN